MDETVDRPLRRKYVSDVYDICVDGSTVIIARFGGHDVLYYKLH